MNNIQIDESKFLELLDIYMDIADKQGEVIRKLSRVLAKQSRELGHLRNLCRCEPEFPELEADEEELKVAYNDYVAACKKCGDI